MQCKKCGKDVGILDKVCPHCGNDLAKIDLRPSPVERKRKRPFDASALTTEIKRSVSKELYSITETVQNEIEKPVKELADESPVKDDFPEKKPSKVLSTLRPIKEVKAKDVSIDIQYLDWVNYSLIHSGLPQINKLTIKNNTSEDAENVFIKIWIPDYGDTWHKTVQCIPSHKSYIEEGIRIHIHKKRLEEVDETENAVMQVEIFSDDQRIFANTYAIRVLAYNEWVYVPGYPELMASFVMPNNEAIEKVVNASISHLKDLCGETSFDGYQSGSHEKVDQMVEALYRAMQEELNITYVNPPASFEKTGQKIFLPDKVLSYQRGTCLDLSLFYIACIERIGIYPLIFMVHGHAFLGYWREESSFQEGCVDNYESIKEFIVDDLLRAVNSTTFTQEGRSFEDSVEEALKILSDEEIFHYAIDVKQARKKGILPMD